MRSMAAVFVIAACGGGSNEPAHPQPSAQPEIYPGVMSKSGKQAYKMAPNLLEQYRLTGDKTITPPAEEKASFRGRTYGSYKFCLDETGHYESGVMLRSTRLPGYDARIVREIMSWTYKPVLVNGAPVPVCTAVTFIYTQR
ncbi:MAG: hypothetical protein QM831_10385 [Kofleriaceae bacterium]